MKMLECGVLISGQKFEQDSARIAATERLGHPVAHAIKDGFDRRSILAVKGEHSFQQGAKGRGSGYRCRFLSQRSNLLCALADVVGMAHPEQGVDPMLRNGDRRICPT